MQTGIAVHDPDKEQGNVMNNTPNRYGSSKEKPMNAIISGLRVTVAVPTLFRNLQNAAVSLRTGKGGMAFSMFDLESGPILVPSIGVYVVKAGVFLPGNRHNNQR